MYHLKYLGAIICLTIILSSKYLSYCTYMDDINIDNELDFTSKHVTTEQVSKSTFHVPDEKWISEALKDIAYYLRNYKFNEWDQRYYLEKPSEVFIGYFDTFPSPILRSLHWKVHENCNSDFHKCISYLQSVIETVPFSRNDDIATLLNDRAIKNETIIKNLDIECKESKFNSERSSLPFENPIEKFRWRTTASYYMCWYTMLGTPALSMLGDTCDNFANCLDPELGHRNRDPRSDDKLSFACATYSFCPDPCCPLKHINYSNQCHNDTRNPCYEENTKHLLNRECLLDRKMNKNMEDIISNRWNVSCNCRKTGFIWKSQFGMCVDINECLSEQQLCDNQTDDCINLPGSFRCICKWGFEFNETMGKCVQTKISISYEDL